MADLITLDEYRLRAGLDVTDTRPNTMISALIPAATRMILNYTGRDFGSSFVTEARLFEYDGSGYLDIDDCTLVTAVALTITGFNDVPLDESEWEAMPPRRDDSPVYYYLLLPGFSGGMYSAEMGFVRNLDVYAREGRLTALPTMIKVTAQWGWPTVPEDVKQAMVWTIQEWMARDSGEGLTSESIESFSRSWGARSGGTSALAIPERARDVLASYAKPTV